jgi:uncharacterized protein
MNKIQISRILNLKLPQGQSAFLWGARKTGKTTLLRQLFPESLVFDFLDTRLYLEMLKEPWLFRERIIAKLNTNTLPLKIPVILDEVQKAPLVLDEVHWLIENKGISFIMSGSSARKLRRGHANLLGGRAWSYRLHPFTTQELPDIDLLRALNHGLIPSHYLSDNPRKALTGYVDDYLTEEIKAEGLTRNLAAFARFMDLLGFCNGNLINFTNIARDCGVNVRTVQEYFSILDETLIGTLVEPFGKHRKRTTISSTPKFYLFDTGIAAFLSRTKISDRRGADFGRLFEIFIFNELKAHSDYSELHYPIRFWRTTSGNEVDFVMGDGEVAIEVKGGGMRIDTADCRSLLRFKDEFKPRRAIIVCTEPEPRTRQDGIEIIPWQTFLKSMWAGELIK